MSEAAKKDLAFGAKYPYDAPNDLGESDEVVPPAATDWAHVAARGILSNLGGRAGIDHELESIDNADTRSSIVHDVAEIIRTAWSDANGMTGAPD